MTSRFSESTILLGGLALRNLIIGSIIIGPVFSGNLAGLFHVTFLWITGIYLVIPLIALIGVYRRHLLGPVFSFLVVVCDMSVIVYMSAHTAFDPNPLRSSYELGLLGVSGFVKSIFPFILIYAVASICAYRELNAIRKGN